MNTTISLSLLLWRIKGESSSLQSHEHVMTQDMSMVDVRPGVIDVLTFE